MNTNNNNQDHQPASLTRLTDDQIRQAIAGCGDKNIWSYLRAIESAVIANIIAQIQFQTNGDKK